MDVTLPGGRWGQDRAPGGGVAPVTGQRDRQGLRALQGIRHSQGLSTWLVSKSPLTVMVTAQQLSDPESVLFREVSWGQTKKDSVGRLALLGQTSQPQHDRHVGLEDPLMQGVLGTAGCGETSLVSTHHVPGAPPPPRADNRESLQTLSYVPWGQSHPWVRTTAVGR